MPLIKKGGVPTRSIEDLKELLNTVALGLTPNFKIAFQGLINSIDDPSIKQQVIDHLYVYLNEIRQSSPQNTGRVSILTIIHHTNTYIQNLTGRNSLPTRRPASSSRSSASSSRSSANNNVRPANSNRSSANNNVRPASSSRSSASSSRSSASSSRSSARSNRSSTRNNNNNH